MALSLRPKWEGELLSKQRKAGQRAGLTQERIAYLATNYFQIFGSGKFTIRKFADKYHIAPTTVRAHFRGGRGDLRKAIAWHTLRFLKPTTDNPQHFLREVFRLALEQSRQQPAMWRLVVNELADNPFISPVFAERICSAIASFAPKRDPVEALELVCSRLAGMIMLETGIWARADIKALTSFAPATKTKKKTIKQTDQTTSNTKILDYVSAWANGLSESAHPSLKAAPKLGASLTKRASPGYIEKEAEKAAALAIAALTKGN